MPRKGPAPKRPIDVDPVFGSPLVSQLVSKVLVDGKKQVVKPGKFQKLWLRVTNDCVENRHQFWYSTDGKDYIPVGDPYPMRAGYWKGIRTGLYCYGQDGLAQFDYYHTTEITQ